MIVIAGAGLAGLACALSLEAQGADWILLEASDTPGGRVATSRTADGYLIDRGFQVLLDSYPTARRLLDLPSLRPRYFESGAVLADATRRTVLRNPLHSPAFLSGTLFSPFSLVERAALAIPFFRGLVASERSESDSGHTTLEEIRSLGMGGAILDSFLGPFFSGVFLERDLSSDASVFRKDLRYFATGRALLPAGGMGEIPRQLASRLPGNRLRYGARVASLVREGEGVGAVIMDDGSRIACDRLVLATEEGVTCSLLGLSRCRLWKGVTTLYFSGNKPLYSQRMLVLPSWTKGESPGVLHFTDLTNAVPEYAPPGKRLLSATLIGLEGEEAVRVARREIGAIFPEFAAWDFLGETAIAEALPEERPGFHGRMPERRPFRDVWLAGDQVTRASIETALASGEQTAAEVLQSL